MMRLQCLPVGNVIIRNIPPVAQQFTRSTLSKLNELLWPCQGLTATTKRHRLTRKVRDSWYATELDSTSYSAYFPLARYVNQKFPLSLPIAEDQNTSV
jgi:hypothetical protein